MTEIFQTILNTIFSNNSLNTLIVFLLIPLILRFFENKYYSDIAQKKNIWNNFIYKNMSIEECFSKFSEVKKESEVGLLHIYFVLFLDVVIMMFTLFISTLLSVLILEWIFINPAEVSYLEQYQNFSPNIFQIVYLSILLLYSFWLAIYREQFYKYCKNIKDDDVLTNFKKVKKTMINISISSVIIFIFAINALTMDYTNIYINLIILFISIIAVIVMYFSISDGRDYVQRIKNKINNQYSKYFPYLRVSIIGGEHIAGKLENMFNLESIVLIDNRTRITIMWDSVASLREEGRLLSHKQPQLSEFFKDI